VRRDLPPDHPEFGRAVLCECRRKEVLSRRMDDLRRASNLSDLERFTFETFLPEGIGLDTDKRANLVRAFEQARTFARQPQGWLVLKGGYGCGKTHLAAAIANYRLELDEPVLFMLVPDLLDHLRAAFSPASPTQFDERFELVRTVELLILDDLGAQHTTGWAQEKLFQILNHRYNARLPTVISTNCELEDIELGLRSRLVDPDVSRIVSIRAPDFRRAGVDREHSGLSALGLYAGTSFESFDLREEQLNARERDNLRRAYELARAYAQAPHDWLVFTGEYGCGKTHLAAAIANQRAQQGDAVLFVAVPDLLDHLRATFSPDSGASYDKRFEEIRTASLLVLDDLGTESATPWAREKLYQIFNHRYSARLSTVITMAQPVEAVHPRLRARMLDRTRCTVFAILVPAYRSVDARSRRGSR
jgi:DNA replication protein DnaC